MSFFRNKQDRTDDISFVGYTNIVALAQNIVSNNSKDEAADLLKYMIRTVVNDLCTSKSADMLYKGQNGILGEPFPLYYYNTDEEKHSIITSNYVTIALKDSNIYVRPWNISKLVNSVKLLKADDFSYYKTNHYSYYFPELDLCYVYNGNHSINAGRFYKKGEIESIVCNMTLLYNNVYTDGSWWYDSHTKKKMLKVFDFRTACLFALSKCLFELYPNSQSSY